MREQERVISPIRLVSEEIERILGDPPMHVHWKPKDSARAHERTLGMIDRQAPMRPLRWTDLTDDQQRDLLAVLPSRGTGDIIEYGDVIAFVTSRAQWEKKERAQAADSVQWAPTLGVPAEAGIAEGPPPDDQRMGEPFGNR